MTATTNLPFRAAESPTKCAVNTRVYRDGQLAEQGFAPEMTSDLLEEEGTIVWLDLLDPDREDLELITGELGLHPLAVDDAVNDRQRPKLDRYDSHLFVNMYDVGFDADTGELTTSEVSAFLTDRALITVRKDERFDIGAVVHLWDENPGSSTVDVGFLFRGLVDNIVDRHFVAVQQLDEGLERLEDVLFDRQARNHEVQRQTFQLRKSLVMLRRVVLPMREVVNSMMRRDVRIVSNAMAPYYQDVYDHVLRVTEWTEGLRDLVQSILEANLFLQSNRLNEVMKQLTAWAAIIAVPTAVTGFYGQNVPYPGHNRHSGFVVSTLLIVTISGLLWGTFRRRRWL